MINTYNETSLHKTLKSIYQAGERGEQDGAADCSKEKNSACFRQKDIFDIVTADGNVIEIQTGSLGHLLPKVLYLCAENRAVTVVYPLAVTKYIQTNNQADGTIRKRKSPVSASIYSYRFFRELTSLCPVLLDKRFTLEVLEVTMTEERTASDDLLQSANGRRRFRKNWNKTGKHLDSIDNKWIFHGRTSWIALLPKKYSSRKAGEFTVSDLYEAYIAQGIKVKRNDVQIYGLGVCTCGDY